MNTVDEEEIGNRNSDTNAEEEIDGILRGIYSSMEQEGGRMSIEQTHSESSLLPATVYEGDGVRNFGSENSQLETRERGRLVEASPLPRGLQEEREESEENLNVEASNFLYLHNTRSFFNKKFNLTGTMYTVRVDNRPEAEDRLDAFNAILQDLEYMLRQIGEDD